jgi:hypothetical protein
MLHIRNVALVAAAVVALAGCGSSDEDQVARALESYPHALAARDAQAACDAFSRDRFSGRDERRPRPPQHTRALREIDERDWRRRCEWTHEWVRRMTPTQRREAAAAEAVRVVVDGDRATGYRRWGRLHPGRDRL